MQVTNPVQAIWWLANGQQAGHSERDRRADLHRRGTFPLRQGRADPVLCDVVALGAVCTAVRRDGGTAFGARQLGVCFTAFTVGGWCLGYPLILGCLKHRKRKRAAADLQTANLVAGAHW